MVRLRGRVEGGRVLAEGDGGRMVAEMWDREALHQVGVGARVLGQWRRRRKRRVWLGWPA